MLKISECLFYAKTTEGYIIKSLCELLKNVIKQGCFIIDSNGISLKMTDNNNVILVDILLRAENFTLYNYTRPQPLSIGLNMGIFYNLVREIKKKDSIILYIEDGNENELSIGIIPKDGVAITTGQIKVQNFQSVDIDTPPVDSYVNPKILRSNTYGKIIKSLSGTVGGNLITISSDKYNIKFLGSSNGICSRNVFISNETGAPEFDEMNHITQVFETEYLHRLSKISSLSSQLHCYQADALPIYIKTQVGSLGSIGIFLKDTSQYSMN